MTVAHVQPPGSPRSALVLAGGGVAGIAWELGVLRGIADADPVLADRVLGADLVVGTSAGSSVAAQITSGVALDELGRPGFTLVTEAGSAAVQTGRGSPRNLH